jgi:hypothetical protein
VSSCWCMILASGSRFVRWSRGIQRWWQSNVLLELADQEGQLPVTSRRSCIRYAYSCSRDFISTCWSPLERAANTTS